MMSYRTLFIAQMIWIFIVAALFIFIPDKRIAGIIAGIGFIILPLLVLETERRKSGPKNNPERSLITCAVVFLVFGALPIFLLRVLNWETDFSSLSILGISAPTFHRASNVLYGLLMITTYRARNNPKGWW